MKNKNLKISRAGLDKNTNKTLKKIEGTKMFPFPKFKGTHFYPLLRYILPICIGQIGKSLRIYFKDINSFVGRLQQCYNKHGAAQLVKELKVQLIILQRYLGNDRVKSARAIEPNSCHWRVYNGLPAFMTRNARNKVRRGHKPTIILGLTLYNVYRVLEVPFQPKLETITKPFQGSEDTIKNIQQYINGPYNPFQRNLELNSPYYVDRKSIAPKNALLLRTSSIGTSQGGQALTFLQSLKLEGVGENVQRYLSLLERQLPSPKDMVESPTERISEFRQFMTKCEKINDERIASKHQLVNSAIEYDQDFISKLKEIESDDTDNLVSSEESVESYDKNSRSPGTITNEQEEKGSYGIVQSNQRVDIGTLAHWLTRKFNDHNDIEFDELKPVRECLGYTLHLLFGETKFKFSHSRDNVIYDQYSDGTGCQFESELAWYVHYYYNNNAANAPIQKPAGRSSYMTEYGNQEAITAQLSFKEEAAGKLRIFAMLDPGTQSILMPLHKHLFKILKLIANDGTHDQSASVRRAIIKARQPYVEGKVNSFDLSAATDRLPLRIQSTLLEYLVKVTGIGEVGTKLLVDRDYHIPPQGSLTYNINVNKVRYSVGQPMGAYSSGAMLALTHHLIMQYCNFQVHGPYGLSLEFKDLKLRKELHWYTNYEVLGDDIIIFDAKVAEKYLEVMKGLGVEINLAKSIRSTNGTFEFAKRLIYNSEIVSGLSGRQFLDYDKLSVRITTVLNLLDQGYIRSPSVLLSVLQEKGGQGLYKRKDLTKNSKLRKEVGVKPSSPLVKRIYDSKGSKINATARMMKSSFMPAHLPLDKNCGTNLSKRVTAPVLAILGVFAEAGILPISWLSQGLYDPTNKRRIVKPGDVGQIISDGSMKGTKIPLRRATKLILELSKLYFVEDFKKEPKNWFNTDLELSIKYPGPNKGRELREQFVRLIEPSYGVTSFLETNKKIAKSILDLPSEFETSKEIILVNEQIDGREVMLTELFSYLSMFSLENKGPSLRDNFYLNKTGMSSLTREGYSNYVQGQIDYADYLKVGKTVSDGDYLSIETAKEKVYNICETLKLSKLEEVVDPLDNGNRILKSTNRIKLNFMTGLHHISEKSHIERLKEMSRTKLLTSSQANLLSREFELELKVNKVTGKSYLSNSNELELDLASIGDQYDPDGPADELPTDTIGSTGTKALLSYNDDFISTELPSGNRSYNFMNYLDEVLEKTLANKENLYTAGEKEENSESVENKDKLIVHDEKLRKEYNSSLYNHSKTVSYLREYQRDEPETKIGSPLNQEDLLLLPNPKIPEKFLPICGADKEVAELLIGDSEVIEGMYYWNGEEVYTVNQYGPK